MSRPLSKASSYMLLGLLLCAAGVALVPNQRMEGVSMVLFAAGCYLLCSRFWTRALRKAVSFGE